MNQLYECNYMFEKIVFYLIIFQEQGMLKNHKMFLDVYFQLFF